MSGAKSTDLPGIGVRLRQSRESAGLSQEQVAQLMRLPRPAISEMENETRRVSAGELVRLANLYKVSIEWLTGEALNTSAAVKIAARKLSGLKQRDLTSVMRIIESLGRRTKSQILDRE